MAKFKDSYPKQTSGTNEYEFGSGLGKLLTRMLATVIRTGNELENYILENSECEKIEDLDNFIKQKRATIPEGVYLCSKKAYKNSKFKVLKREPDFIVFLKGKRYLKGYVIELKTGGNFDTKKVESEKNIMEGLANTLSRSMKVKMSYYICCFNISDKEEIVKGLKGRFDISNILNGEELCEILKVERKKWEDIQERERKENIKDVLTHILHLSEFSNFLKESPEDVAVALAESDITWKTIFLIISVKIKLFIKSLFQNVRRCVTELTIKER